MIAEVSNECKVPVDAEDYVESFRPTLMDVTWRWSQGAPFAEVPAPGWMQRGSKPITHIRTRTRARTRTHSHALTHACTHAYTPHTHTHTHTHSLSLSHPPTPQVAKLTELYEGSIIRATRRLDELLTQLADAAAEVGDGRLKQQFLDAQASIRRDIVFAASLYL